jgi:hypothetical protein
MPGWGLSWWIVKQGISAQQWREQLTAQQRIELTTRFFREANAGWRPKRDDGSEIPKSEWTYHPWKPDH